VSRFGAPPLTCFTASDDVIDISYQGQEMEETETLLCHGNPFTKSAKFALQVLVNHTERFHSNRGICEAVGGEICCADITTTLNMSPPIAHAGEQCSFSLSILNNYPSTFTGVIDFGDQETTTQNLVQGLNMIYHTYESTGSYDLSITLTDDNMTRCSYTEELHIVVV